MSDPVTPPEQPEPAQSPSSSTQPPAAQPAAPVQASYPVPPAPARQRGAGFTVLVAAATALVVAVVVAAGTAFGVTRLVDRDPHRTTVGISEPGRCPPDAVQRPDQSGRWDGQRGPDADGQTRRGLPDDPSSRAPDPADSSEQGESQQGS